MSAVVAVGLRRLGSNRVHRADVPIALRYVRTVLGQDCVGIKGPIVARCGAKLRGSLIEIPHEYLVMESQRQWQCGHCLSELRHDYRDGAQAVAPEDVPA